MHGARTEVVQEQYESGADTRDIAETHRLSPEDVIAALDYENRRRRVPAA